ncbi:helix-turn-helix domain-containing protein [Chishuiella sp.]|uniref:helix-turn-helix domain-containing protein n=1 Tax=Chishuiella sp. TaxID=1969467 RepID=UPI0028A97997|nr:helix-turn-helix domain-containing protein [Chishuiella sp.]
MIINNNSYRVMSIERGLAVYKINNYMLDIEWINRISSNNYFGIIWSGNKNFTHQLNKNEIIIPKNYFLFIPPNSKQSFINKEQSDAYYILFKQEFYSKSIEENLKLENDQLFLKETINLIENKICSAPIFEKYFINSFYQEIKNELDTKLFHNLLERIILNGQFETVGIQKKIVKNNYDIEIASKFKDLLQRNVNQNRHVSFYTDLLFVTKRRLDKATLIIFDKTAKEMIIDQLIKNSKILLINSKKTIKEISIELNFPQETNFTAFFKKNLGVSPSQFRQKTPS